MADGRPGDGDLRERADPSSSDHALSAPAAQVPVRRRRTALVLVPMVVLLLAGAVLYLRGGDRLAGAGGGVTAPVDVGAEFHTTVFLATDGAVELVSARPVDATPALEVELTLVQPMNGASGIGAARGPLDDERYRQLPLEGHRLRATNGDEADLLIDVRLVPRARGIHQLRAIEVTYRSGPFRERTAVLDARVCLTAWTDWTVAPESSCPLPGE